MTEQVATYENKAAILETVLIKGDLAKLTEAERISYYYKMCEVVGVNPHTRPFEYIVLNGKLTLYARKDCTDQIRRRDGLSTRIAATENDGETYTVRAVVSDQNGRTEESSGAVAIAGLKGEARANAMMKAETKGKRRGTLSFAGLGMLDETEVEDIPNARPAVTVENPKPAALPQGHAPTPERQALEDKARGLYNEAKRLGVAIPPAPGKTCTIPMLEQWIEDLADAFAAKA